MRNLQTHDIFVAMKVVNSVGVADEIKRVALMVSEKKEVNIDKIGIEFLFSIMAKCANDNTENLIYEFLGGILEMDPKDIKVMDPMELVENIKKLNEVISVEQWKAFFQSLLNLIRQQI